jgi:acyl-CoA synthetase (AMP-forming)/AMP-acid ligase II/pimeloyl-ACP methyl ester carboxylesterase
VTVAQRAAERSVEVVSHDGRSHLWSILDRPGDDPAAATVVCLHGNPTWSFLWSRVIDELASAHRVIAPDQLNMGRSERVGPRNYRARVEDVADLLHAMHLEAPVWLVAQDWGGAIAMGVAVHHPELVAGLVLSNTGIAVPQGRRAPWLIRMAAAHGVHRFVTRSTPLFVRGTPWLPGGHLSRAQRRALAAPYRRAADRDGVAEFVADVPFDDRHPSAAAIAEVADRLVDVRVPVRLVWGGRDPVFDDSFADDLLQRFSAAQLHRLPRAGHLAVLEASIAPFIEGAIESTRVPSSGGQPSSTDTGEPLWASIAARAHDSSLAIDDAAVDETVSHSEFAARVGRFAVGLRDGGVRPGDRIAVLVPPSVDLLAVIYACWRIGAVTVVADRGLGLRGLGAAVRSARVRHVVGPRTALAAARALRWAPRASGISLPSLRRAAAGAVDDLSIPSPAPAAPAAVVFTSGATGPAKGVRYTHGQLCAQRDAIRAVYDIRDDDRFVAAFAPFAVFGPALGIVTGLADMDVTAPATLTATALEDACRRVGATMVFASPAALANVVRTASSPMPSLGAVRLVLSAGAPVPIATLESMARLCPRASLHTPYGMTEILPVADESLVQRRAVGPGRGVCVGRPVEGCDVRIAAMHPLVGVDQLAVGSTGEVLVRARWMSSGYDRLFLTEARARPTIDGAVWHRTGDVGHLDHAGDLWIEGRVVHTILTATGPVTPVPLEIAVEALPGVRRAAAVGVGPAGVQQVVLVVETDAGDEGAASAVLAAAAREAVEPQPIAAVWTVADLPVDIRHNSKIDRASVAARMERVLSGARR